jgi:hypothetical protein
VSGHKGSDWLLFYDLWIFGNFLRKNNKNWLIYTKTRGNFGSGNLLKV